MSTDPRSWLDRAAGICFSFVLAALALYVGVQLLLAVWQILLAIIVGVTVFGVGLAWLRQRNRGW